MFCNSLVAIASGFMANFAADQKGLTESMAWPGFYTGGNSSPFDLAMLFLGACWLCISLKWSENYGDQGAPDNEASALSLSAIMDGVEIIRNDSKIFIIGVLAACFEGSMYTFVFLWTPILTQADSSSLPFGNIFAVSHAV
jgi:hypothetical protein